MPLRHARLVPELQADGVRWSAFVTPDLAAIFSEEPWLDLPPNPDAQAHVLARLECIKPAVWQALLQRMEPVAAAPARPVPQPADASRPGPRAFLQAVMNDPGVDMALRVEAAKALLPYSEDRPR